MDIVSARLDYWGAV
ncbi:hypothetical protein ACS0PU_008154 [Formica fusca]